MKRYLGKTAIGHRIAPYPQFPTFIGHTICFFMALSWNEIKDRAQRFSKEWAGTTRERADVLFELCEKYVAA